jgi:glyoxylase-like metal-dependent hydrolase (beta-lactamase superfamily II)
MAHTIDVGEVRLTRVSYAEIDLPPEGVGLTADDVRAVAWAEPAWATGGNPRVAAAAWIIEHDGARIIVDPAQAADDILRNDNDAAFHQEAFAAMLADAGFARETITHAVATHEDGIGMFAWRDDDGAWSPFFPTAPMLISQRELDAIERGEHPSDGRVLKELHAKGALQLTGEREQITSAVSLEHTGAHTPGHQVVRIESKGERAVFVGHLAVNPLHFVTGPCPALNLDPESGWKIVTELRSEDALLVGPLWPEPGAGRWDGTQLVPASRVFGSPR